MADVRMILVGDAYVQRSDPDSAFAPNLAYFEDADIFFCNLETVVAGPEYVAAQPMRRAPRTDEWMLAAYQRAGINVMNVANNPSTYHGIDCFVRSLDVLDGAGALYGGGGRNLAEARKPVVIEKDGTRVAFVCRASVCLPEAAATAQRPGIAYFRIVTSYEPRARLYEVPGTLPITRTYPNPEDRAALEEDIRQARSDADVVVVSWHWGLSPSSGARGELAAYQTEMGRFAIDAGADLVVGHHPHMLQPIEVYHGKVIAYSLGNYVHDLTTGSGKLTSMLLRCLLRDRQIRGVSFVPGWVTGAGPAIYRSPALDADIVEHMWTISEHFGTKFAVGKEDVVVLDTQP